MCGKILHVFKSGLYRSDLIQKQTSSSPILILKQFKRVHANFEVATKEFQVRRQFHEFYKSFHNTFMLQLFYAIYFF